MNRMNHIAIALLALLIAAPAAAQDWERVFDTVEAGDGGYKVLMLDPSQPRSSTDRYKLVSLADLMAPVYTFPDSATRYVANKASATRPTFTATEMAAGGTSPGLLTAAPIPRPTATGVWVAVAVPENRPLTYGAIGTADRRTDRTGVFVPQAGTVTLGDDSYAVWVANETWSGGLDRRFMFFARAATVP